jgi:hypothetical protein
MKARTLDIGSEFELGKTLVLVIVPNHDLVGWVLGILASPDQRQQIGPEEHFYNAQPAIEFCPPPV